MNRRGTVATVSMLALAAAGAAPALAGPAVAKPLKGTWSFTDATPDPSGNAQSSESNHCQGKLPSAPSDVNSHTIKVTRPGTLTVTGHVVGDWAIEIDDAKGSPVFGDDVNPPDSEGAALRVKKGTYAVIFCNLEGAPTASADYAFKPR
jgi:hypothetical protein